MLLEVVGWRQHRARNVVVGVGGVLFGVLFIKAFIDDNPERRALKQQEKQAAAELLQRRAIAQNLDHFREEFEKLRARATMIERTLSPDLEALGRALPEGVELTRRDPRRSGSLMMRPFDLEGDPPTFEATLATLDASGLVLDVAKIRRSDGGWSVQAIGFEYLPEEPEVDEARDDGPPWYGRLNDDVRSEIERMEAEVEALDQQLGEVAAYTSLKRWIEERLEATEALRRRRRDVRPVVSALAVGASAVFTAIDAGAEDADAVHVEGRGEVTREQVQSLLSEAWQLDGLEPSRPGWVSLDVTRAKAAKPYP